MTARERQELPWNSDTEYALGFYRKLTRLLGIWPLERSRLRSILQVTVTSALQLLLIITLCKDLIATGNCGVVTDVIDAIGIIISGPLMIMKLVSPHINEENIRFIVNSAIEDWADSIDDKSRKTMRKYAFIGRVIFITQMSGAYFIVIPLILGNYPNFYADYYGTDNTTLVYRNIPVGPNCWIAPTMSTNAYLFYHLTVSSNVLILGTVYIGSDVYIFGLAMHICGQFEVLYSKMESIAGEKCYSALRQQVNQVCYRHNVLLQIAEAFERSFNVVLLFQVASSTIIVTISGIIVLLGVKYGDVDLVVSSTIRIFVLYLQFFMYSYIGEQLTTQTEKLKTAVYSCSWHQMAPSIVRDLSFVIMRTNRPFYFTAGNILKMNMVGFKDLLRTLFSYFSVLRLMFE